MSDIDTDLLDRIASQFRWELFKLCSNTLSGDFPGREIEQLCRRYVGVALREQATEISRLRSLTTWRPIEEADKSQRIRVWAWDAERHATWNDDRYAVRPRPFWDIDGFQISSSRAYQPTHFLLIPPPPETKT